MSVPTLRPLVVALRRQLARVMVVDDGSADDTAALARRRRGHGAASRSKSRQGHGAPDRVVGSTRQGFNGRVTLDGDGQHVPEDLPAFLQCAEQTGARLVIGNRMHQARAIPWLRRQVNRWMSRQLSRRAGRHLPDTQCGFRLIHLETWATLSLRREHFEIESEMLMAFLAAGHPVEFVPIRVIGRGRSSHIRPLTDSLRWWKWWRQLNHPGSRRSRASSHVRVNLPATAHAPLLARIGRCQTITAGLLGRIPDVLSGRVDVTEFAADLDPRQTIDKRVGIVKLGIDNQFSGGINISPMFRLAHRRQAVGKLSRRRQIAAAITNFPVGSM